MNNASDKDWPHSYDPFGYRKRAMVTFWKVPTLLDNDSKGPQNAGFLQLEQELERYKLTF